MIYVADSDPERDDEFGNFGRPKVFAYAKDSNGGWRHNPSGDLNGDDQNGVAGEGLSGIWTDGEVLWSSRASGVARRIGAYHLIGPEKNRRLPAEDFEDFTADVADVRGLWSDGETLWAAGRASSGTRIDAYDMVTKRRVASKSFTSTNLQVPGGTVNPWGIWSDGTTMWVVGNNHIRSFNMPVSNNATLRRIRVEEEPVAGFDPDASTQTLGLPNNASTVTVEPVPRHFLATYAITSTDDVTGTPGHQIDVSGGAKTVTATVTAQDNTTTKTYNIEFGHLPALIVGAVVTPGPRNLTVGWDAPSNSGTSDVTSYDLRHAPTGEDDLADESAWTEVTGVWQTGDNALSHVIDGLDPRLEYYVQVRAVNSLGPGPWIPHSRLSESGRGTPQATGSTVSSLSALSLSPGTLSPAFAADEKTYSVKVGASVREVTVTATATDASNAKLSFLGGSGLTKLTDQDRNMAGFQVDVGSGRYTITVRVTAESLVDTTDYTITVTRAEADTGANLSGLTLNDSDLDALLDFDTGTTSYTLTAPNIFWQITVTPTARSPFAMFAFLDGASGTTALNDADNQADGFQVDLVGGTQKIFRIVVTAEQGNTETYTLRITRTQPLVGVEAVPAEDDQGMEVPYVEGDSLEFTISLNGPAASDLVVRYDVRGTLRQYSDQVTIDSGQESVDVTVATDDDQSYEAHNHVTLMLPDYLDQRIRTRGGQGGGHRRRARRRLRPQSSAMSCWNWRWTTTTVEEGGTATVTVWLWLENALNLPHAPSPAVRLFTRDDSATAGADYQALDIEVSIPPEDFTSIGMNPLFGNDAYFGTATVEIPIHRDADAEDAEEFDVVIDNDAGYLNTSGLDRTITIASSEAASTEAALGSLSASPATLAPAFDPAITAYTASVANTVAAVTLAAEASSGTDAYKVEYLDSNDAEIVDADDVARGLQAALAVGENIFTVRVTAQDRSTTQDYAVTITRSLSDVATLSALAIRDSASAGTFSRSLSTSCTTCTYSVQVAADVEQLTITPTLTDAGATVSYHRGNTELTDADTGTADTFEVDLVEGGNVIEVRVTAADGVATKSYTMTVTRLSDKPVAGVRAPGGAPVEGNTVSFTVTLSRAPEADVTVGVSASETGDMIAAGPRSVTFAAGETSATVEVTTGGDTAWEAHSDITLEIVQSTNDDYVVSGPAGSATKTVRDDDFPLSDAVLALTDDTVDEGADVTATVTVTTRGDEQPHSASGFMVLSTRDGPGTGGAVSPDDFTAVASQRFNLAAARFTQVDLDEDPVEEDLRWRAAYELTIRTVDDANPETAETFDVVATVDAEQRPRRQAVDVGFAGDGHDPHQRLRRGAHQRRCPQAAPRVPASPTPSPAPDRPRASRWTST